MSTKSAKTKTLPNSNLEAWNAGLDRARSLGPGMEGISAPPIALRNRIGGLWLRRSGLGRCRSLRWRGIGCSSLGFARDAADDMRWLWVATKGEDVSGSQSQGGYDVVLFCLLLLALGTFFLFGVMGMQVKRLGWCF
jgi:hypothetical protein